MQDHFEITVNGTRHSVARAAVARPFLAWLREDLGLIGTKAGTCAGGACTGACVVCVLDWDGRGRATYRALSACRLTLPMAAGRTFVTVEALGSGREAHPVLRAQADADAGGCGYCAGGLSMALFEIYYRQDVESAEDVRDALSGHVCRCGAARGAAEVALRLAREARERRRGSGRAGKIERARRRRRNAPRIPGDAFEAALAGFTSEAGGFAYIDPAGARFHRPRSLLELLRLRKEHAGAVLVGGGLGARASRTSGAACLLSTEAVVEMGAVLDLGRDWEVGASVTLSGLREAVGGRCEMLGQMLAGYGSRASRNRATLGGALCAPESTGEVGPAFVALGATAILAGLEGEREMPLEDFLADAPEESLRGEEVLRAVRLPCAGASERLCGMARVSPRRRNAPSIASLAVDLEIDGDRRVTRARVVTGAAWARPVRALACESALVGQPWNGATVKRAAQALREAAPAFTNELSGGDYRRAVTGALLQRFFYENSSADTRHGNAAEAARTGKPGGAVLPPADGEADVPSGEADGMSVSAEGVEWEEDAAVPAPEPPEASSNTDSVDEALEGIFVDEEGSEAPPEEIPEAVTPEPPSADAGQGSSCDPEAAENVEEAQDFEDVFVDADPVSEEPAGDEGFGVIFVDPDGIQATDPTDPTDLTDLTDLTDPTDLTNQADPVASTAVSRPPGVQRAKLPPPRKASLDVQPRNGLVTEREGRAP